MKQKLISKKQVAELFSVSVRSVERLAARGKLTKVKIGGCVRFKLKEVEAMMEGEESTLTEVGKEGLS
ncbi:MAG: helix-turn-helix domain-containing protein [Opitutae bacterium]|jgi:excisionase family DNA binding protein|nr:helix-turn-helix domain-containing protein [Opitutae bacterium]MBT4666001.1 helix-turn-helix domain-containing protein [Opitutae bacterium]MBT5909045.1 helix-turn-helix domain-containing protein [Opitutae bacterium]MBT6852096.1 helix-turn-helix domain-containing protein [Opitutae bacterium]MBT7743138.1 helix-turn-helix domain-containing protein [Opitutae bacterium]